MMWGDMGGWGWPLAGMLHMALWWVLLVLAIVVLIKWLLGSGTRGSDLRALEILKERYARGEIGKDEYEQKRRDLSG
jgi:putative membrane protein